MRFGLTRRIPSENNDVDMFRRHVNSLFDDFFSPGPTGFFDTDWAPAVDIEETDKGYVVKAEMPGMNEKDISVTVENNVLTIQGEKKDERERKSRDSRTIISERSYGTFRRSFTLPDSVDAGKIAAEFKDGILKVTVPAEKARETKQISIKVN